MTNADKIRGMTDTELYELLFRGRCFRCAWYGNCKHTDPYRNCCTGLIEWLKHETKRDENNN